ncbi:MAG: hypothetical protein ACC613_07740 [Synergistales bacterium]
MTDLGPKLAPTVKRRRGMALPLVILLVIVGFVFVGVGAYVVRNLFWSSQGVVIESKLYNAAQSGIEWGMALIWERKDNIEADLITSVDSLDDIRARMDNLGSGVGTDYLEDEKALPETDGNITLTVTLLDCNYSLAAGATVANLPPRVLAGTGSGGTGTPAIPPGTSVIIDPSHFLPLGGGVTSHSFVIRSRATGFGRSTELESMVVIEK